MALPGRTLPASVSLVPLRRALVRRELFPWRVVISTTDPGQVGTELSRFRDWLGIGVDVDDPVAPYPLGRCTAGYDGLDGLAGGMVRTPEPFLVTCQHVVSTACQSLAKAPSGRGHVSPRGQSAPIPPAAPRVTSVPAPVLLRPRPPRFPAPHDPRPLV